MVCSNRAHTSCCSPSVVCTSPAVNIRRDTSIEAMPPGKRTYKEALINNNARKRTNEDGTVVYDCLPCENLGKQPKPLSRSGIYKHLKTQHSNIFHSDAAPQVPPPVPRPPVPANDRATQRLREEDEDGLPVMQYNGDDMEHDEPPPLEPVPEHELDLPLAGGADISDEGSGSDSTDTEGAESMLDGADIEDATPPDEEELGQFPWEAEGVMNESEDEPDAGVRHGGPSMHHDDDGPEAGAEGKLSLSPWMSPCWVS